MRLLGEKSYPDLLNIFAEENSFKDGWYPNSNDTWPRGRFKEAESQFGKWGEFELSHAEILDVRLIWNKEFGIPEGGMTVSDALKLKSVAGWLASGKHRVFKESHLWLASAPLKSTSAVEYGLLKDFEGHLIPLDGIHRLLAWAYSGKEMTLAFIAHE
jgi:hypothetical protein